MDINNENLRKYLLGNDEDRELISEWMFESEDNLELLLAHEGLLFESFIDGELTNKELSAFTAIYNTSEALESISLIKVLRKSAQVDKVSKITKFFNHISDNLKFLRNLKVEIIAHY